MVDRRRLNRQAAQTLAWNINRSDQLEDLLNGAIPVGAAAAGEGWWVVSRHASGTQSAYVAMNRLKKQYPTIVFKVVNTVDDSVDWDAQIIAKLKEKQ